MIYGVTSAERFRDAILVYASEHGTISTDDVADVCIDELDELVMNGSMDKIDDEEYLLSDRGKARVAKIANGAGQ